jgi:hypothetical protein
MLFAGTSRGTLWSLKFPLTIPGEWQELQGHGSTISKVYTQTQLKNLFLEIAIRVITHVQTKKGDWFKYFSVSLKIFIYIYIYTCFFCKNVL